MKTIKLVASVLFIAIISATISSCEGEAGPAGADGNDGNANVQVGTMDLTNSDWLWRGSYTFSPSVGSSTSYFTRYVDINIPEITEDIFNTGLVLVYYKPYVNTDDWDPLPFQFTSFGGGYITYIAYRSEVGKIRLHYFWTPNGSATPSGLETHTIADAKVKYIIIEGQSIAGGRTANPNQTKEKLETAGVDLNDYYAVCEYYGINP